MKLSDILEQVKQDPKVLNELVGIIAREFNKGVMSFQESPEYFQGHVRAATHRRWAALMDERHRRAAVSTYDFIDKYLSIKS